MLSQYLTFGSSDDALCKITEQAAPEPTMGVNEKGGQVIGSFFIKKTGTFLALTFCRFLDSN